MTAANQRERYTASVLRSYKEEIEKIFGDNPEYGKEIEI